MKDIKIKALGNKMISDNYLVKICTPKAVKAINEYFDSEKMKNDEYIISYSYYTELMNLANIANLKIEYEENDYFNNNY